MNIQWFAASILALVATLVHLFAGEKTDIKHLMLSGMPINLKIEMRMCWYMVAIDMAVSGIYLLGVGLRNMLPMSEPLLRTIALRFVLYGLVALLLILFTQKDHLLKVPQWALLMAIGLLV